MKPSATPYVQRLFVPLATCLLLGACSQEDNEEWMIRNGYWAVHTVCGSGTTTKGIDVSKWQATVDWAKVAADGVKFGVARTSDGTTYDDAYFTANWKGMKSNGIIRGAYQFFRPDQDPVAQAKFMISKLNKAGGLQSGDLPPVLDLEKNGGLSASNVVKAVDKWIAYIEQNTGRRPIIYTGSYFWDASAATTKYKSYPLWTAHYTSATCPLVPNAWSKWAIWQYSSKGSVKGVSGSCDMNRFNGTVSDIKALAAKSVINPPPQDAAPPKPDQGVPKPDKFVPKPDKFAPKPDLKKPPQPDLKQPPKVDQKVQPRDKGKPAPKKDGGNGPRLDTAPPLGPGLNSTLSGGCTISRSTGDTSSLLLTIGLLAFFWRRRREMLV